MQESQQHNGDMKAEEEFKEERRVKEEELIDMEGNSLSRIYIKASLVYPFMIDVFPDQDDKHLNGALLVIIVNSRVPSVTDII